MPGRVAIVTGGSRGIGAEIVRMLLQCDMEVIIGIYGRIKFPNVVHIFSNCFKILRSLPKTRSR